MKFAIPNGVTTFVSLGVAMIFSGGCLSTHPGSSSLAYVVVEGASIDAISEEAIRVFGDEFYEITSNQPEGIVFEREATQRDRVLWGRYQEEDLRMRVVVAFEPLANGGILVRADAYILPGGAFSREEKIVRMGRRPYQALLNRVKASLVTSRPGSR